MQGNEIEIVYDMDESDGTGLEDVLAGIRFCDEARAVIEAALVDIAQTGISSVDITPGQAVFRFYVADPSQAVAAILGATSGTRFDTVRSIGFGKGLESAA